jgi:hypothetical protein
VFLVRYDLGSYIPEDEILHSHRLKTSNLTQEKYIHQPYTARLQFCLSVTLKH